MKLTREQIEAIALREYPCGNMPREVEMERWAQREALIKGMEMMQEMEVIGVELKHVDEDEDDIFGCEMDVTGCCGIGPITRENYCYNCGGKIKRTPKNKK